MTRQQKKAVRKALRQYGRKQKAADAAGCAAAGPDPWGRVIRQALDYYAEVDGTCADLLRLRYLEERPEAETIENLLPQGAGNAEHGSGVCCKSRADLKHWVRMHPVVL